MIRGVSKCGKFGKIEKTVAMDGTEEHDRNSPMIGTMIQEQEILILEIKDEESGSRTGKDFSAR